MLEALVVHYLAVISAASASWNELIGEYGGCLERRAHKFSTVRVSSTGRAAGRRIGKHVTT
jgi:hypothetical protein